MNCKDCKNSRKVNHYNDSRLECVNLDKISDGDGNLSATTNDELVYEHQEGGKFFVGEHFGCVHFAPKSKLQQSLGDNKLSEPISRVDIDRLLDPSKPVDGIVIDGAISLERVILNIMTTAKLDMHLRFIHYREREFNMARKWLGDLATGDGVNAFKFLDVVVLLVE